MLLSAYDKGACKTYPSVGGTLNYHQADSNFLAVPHVKDNAETALRTLGQVPHFNPAAGSRYGVQEKQEVIRDLRLASCFLWTCFF